MVSQKRDPQEFRDHMSVICVSFVLISYITLGWAVITAQILYDKTVVIPSDWNTVMTGLVGTAIGYFAGKNTPATSSPTGSASDPISIETSEKPVCADCKPIASPKDDK